MKRTLLLGIAVLITLSGGGFAEGREVETSKSDSKAARKETPATKQSEEKAQIYTGSNIPRKLRKNGEITDGSMQLRIIDEDAIRHSGAVTVAGVLNSRGVR